MLGFIQEDLSFAYIKMKTIGKTKLKVKVKTVVNVYESRIAVGPMFEDAKYNINININLQQTAKNIFL